ncbi:MAG: O-methyltransferase [Verrucomicrobiales bacterium]
MPGSYRIINYALRPAKVIERRMLCAAFERLHPFQRVQHYRYLGFGSIYFSDFQLVHRALGITDMISIEKDVSAKACFRFNRPYRCIRLKFATSAETLPTINWRRRSIVWLDYDDRLSTEILGDIATVCLRAASGSLLVVTVNAQPDAEPPKEERDAYQEQTGKPFDLADYRLRIAKGLLGEKLPMGTTGADLRGQEVARLFRDVIHNVIEEQISLRNTASSEAERVQYRQLFHFRYKDGAQMLTVGGMLHHSSEENKFLACGFSTLPFIRHGTEPCNIKAPCLTPKEIRHLNAQLPKKGSPRKLSVPGVPDADVERYAEVYRYFPSFSEVLFS